MESVNCNKNEVSLSFVVPVFGCLEYTRNLVTYLLNHPRVQQSSEIIIVNDASTDSTAEYLASLSDYRVIIINNNHNQGFARSVNIGITRSRGKIICMINNDVDFLNDDWLRYMYDVFSKKPNIGCVGNLQYSLENTIDHAGVCIDHIGRISHIRDLNYHGDHSGIKPIFAVTGACMMFYRDLYDKLGGFDEKFVNGGEDIDFCIRAKNAGYANYVSLDSCIIHYGGATRGKNNRRDDENSYLLYRKWYPQIKEELEKNIVNSLVKNPQFLIKNGIIDCHVKILLSKKEVPEIASYNIIQRHFERWSREIDGYDSSIDICKIKPIRLGHYCYQIDLLSILALKNFFIVGRILNRDVKVQIVIEVSGVMEKVFEVEYGPFNLGIREPFLFQDKPNTFNIYISPLGIYSKVKCAFSECVLIEHMVIDDHIVPLTL